MENKFFEELSRRLREGGIESSNVEDKRLEVFLHGRPVLFVSPGHDAFLLPAGSQNQKASELYHRVAEMADEVYEYVEAVQNAPLLRASSLKDEFHLLADFGGAVLAGIELPKEWGYQFNTWIWNYDRTALLYDPTQGIRIVHRSKEKSWRQIKVFHDVEQLPERGHRNSIGDASDVGAALSKLQAHPMLRNALLFPQLCDAVPHKRFIAAVIVHDPLPPISTYYFNIRERRGFALKSSTFASHNE